MKIKVFGSTHIGMVRSNNEDAYGIYPELSLFIVSDGLGGHAGGEVASRLAVDTIRESIAPACVGHAVIRGDIVEAIKRANRRITEEVKKEPHLRDMGTTAVVVRIEGDKAIIAHVGDSRAYVIRNDVISQITKDHTVVEEYVRIGLLAPQDAQYHPYRHILSRVLGTSGDVEVDTSNIKLKVGDTLILCTDGLTNMVIDREILYAVLDLRPFPEKITERLINLANKNGGIDNITVITICIVDQVN